nr:ribonuclease H-like domain-containing protein [Tanacetum cinerariifolium]
IVDNAWIKHSKDQFHAPTAQDMEILIQTFLMPLALKTQNDSFIFMNLKKHSVSLELALQKCKEQVKNDTVWNEQASNVFRKEREQNIKIQDLKAQLNKKPNVVPISTRKPESHAKKSVATPHKKKVTSKSTTQKPKSYYRMLYKKSGKAWKWWIEQQCPSGYKWVPKTKMQWVPKAKNEDVQKRDVVIGLPKLKFVKDQLCSSCELSKAKRSSFKSKAIPSSKGRLNLLYMDLCGPMRVASINGKKYILVIIDDYLRYTWTLFPRSKDETPEIKEKGDPCILVGYSTQSKGYHVYNKRTRLLVKSIHIRFDEIKEMSETSIANDTLGLVPQRQKASDYDNSDPVPQLQNVSS